MGVVRRCLACSATYPVDEHACPKCGSHAADVEKVRDSQTIKAKDTAAKPKPPVADRSATEGTGAKPKPPRRPRKT